MMLSFRNACYMLRKHLVQLGCIFLSWILIAKRAKVATANISGVFLVKVTDINSKARFKGQILAFWSPKHIMMIMRMHSLLFRAKFYSIRYFQKSLCVHGNYCTGKLGICLIKSCLLVVWLGLKS